MNILFVSRNFKDKCDGGTVVVQRNLSLLESIASKVSVLTIPKPSITTRVKNILFRESYGNTASLKLLLKWHLKQNYDIVFFDSSLYGCYLKRFFDKGFKTCCFYHNIEYKYYFDKYLKTRKIQDKAMIGYIKYNERLSTQYSTYRITLNERDSNDLFRFYGKKADFMLPTSFDPINIEFLKDGINSMNHPYILFVGSNFFANVEGLDFLFNKVAPYIQYDIKIVGNVCDAFQNKELPSNVKLVGRVDDLLPYYANAMCVVAPIFSGSGLKTKTIEAIRYGKYIIGSSESFEGIETVYRDKIGKLCCTPEDFIDAINNCSVEKINKISLALFNQLYSNDAQKRRLKSFFVTENFMV